MKNRILTNIKSREDARDYLTTGAVETTKRLYLTRDMTSREVCEIMGLGDWYRKHPQYYNRLLNSKFPKGKQHGGLRIGSGNKKGIKFCGECKQQRKHCRCLPEG